MKYSLSQPQYIYELGGRANQEDSLFPEQGQVTAQDRLFILCDGMGGHEAGEVASKTVCEAMSRSVFASSPPEEVFTSEQFEQALSAAYDELDARDNGAARKMGTTLVFLKFHSGGCFAAHIGDSRIYHIRPSGRAILYRSRDHSLVNDLFDIGEITREEMKTSKQRNVITRAMQPHQGQRVKADIREIADIRPGDYFFMCSDGMLEELEDDNLLNIVCDPDNDDTEKIRILREVTRDNRDNHSAFLIPICQASDELQQEATVPTVAEQTGCPKKSKFFTIFGFSGNK